MFSSLCRRPKINNTALGEAGRYYGKDAPVPPAWAKWLAGAIPEKMQALGSGDIMRYLKDSVLTSHSGETPMLDTSLQDQAETLMCYFGVGDTYTPAHKDLCASIGHNLLSTCIFSLTL